MVNICILKKRILTLHLTTALTLFLDLLWLDGFFYPTGNFGGGVQSFFVFLRFLVLLNLVTSLLIAGFVLVPSIIFRSSSSSSASFLVNVTFNDPGIGFHSKTLCFSSEIRFFFTVSVSQPVKGKVGAPAVMQQFPGNSLRPTPRLMLLFLQLHQLRCSPQT